jgi:hypothetical protein
MYFSDTITQFDLAFFISICALPERSGGESCKYQKLVLVRMKRGLPEIPDQ